MSWGSKQKYKMTKKQAHDKAHNFLLKKIEELQGEKQMWNDRYDKENAEMAEKLGKLRDERGTCIVDVCFDVLSETLLMLVIAWVRLHTTIILKWEFSIDGNSSGWLR